jgi:DNA repair exonuclease SbcCD ATPase subunit
MLDTCRSIAASLDRNRTRYSQSLHSKAHSEAMASTIQSLTSSHQETLLQLQGKYSLEAKNAESLHDQLSAASSEIQSMQSAYKSSQTKLEMMEQECNRLEQLLIKERTEIHQQLNDRQKDLNNEREVGVFIETNFAILLMSINLYKSRSKAEELHQKQIMELNDKFLGTDAKLRNALLDLNVIAKDKSSLQEDLDQAKEKERKLIQLWEGNK